MYYGHVNIFYCVQEGQSFFWIVATVEENWQLVSLFPQLQKYLRKPWKLCMNLCSEKRLKPSFSCDRSFILLGLWQLNVLLGDDLINGRILVILISSFQSSNLISSTQLSLKKKRFLKKSCFTFIAGILLHCLVLCDVLCVWIIQ